MKGNGKGAVLLGAGAAVACGCCAWMIRDYRAWKALGPGGLPHSARGYSTMLLFRAMAEDGRSVERLTGLSGRGRDHAYLTATMPERNGRPEMARWPVPQRQLNQHISDDMRARLIAAFNERVFRHGGTLDYRPSFFEKHGPAITLNAWGADNSDAQLSRGEVAHVHKSDSSMHMILSPSDARTVISHRWGELHGLAGRAGLPKTYTFVYPPRDDEELERVSKILDAAIAYMSS